MEKDYRLSVRIPIEMRNEFQKICDEKALNGSKLVRQWIEQFIERHKQEKKK